MIALDTNILVDLLIHWSEFHASTKRWLENVRQPLVTTETNIGEWLRIVTHRRIYPSPPNVSQSAAAFRQFSQSHDLRILRDQDEWWNELQTLSLSEEWLRGNNVFDARVALCLRYHGVREIATRDADFTKYPFLRVVNPTP